MSDSQKSKDLWDILQIFGVVMVPIVIGITGFFINTTLKDREIAVKYTEISLSILRSKSIEVPSLKNWAIDILEKHSPVPFSPAAKNELKRGRIVSATVTDGVIFSDKFEAEVVRKK